MRIKFILHNYNNISKMKVHLQKALRMCAIFAALFVGHQNVLASANPVDSILNHLKTHIISQTYNTGAWVANGENVNNRNSYDYGIGDGEIVGDNAEKLIFNNFFIPGLNVDISITTSTETNWKGTFMTGNINVDISKVYQLKTGYSSKYTPAYEGKYAKIYPLYQAENENSWGTPTESGIKTVDNQTYSYLIPSGENADTYTIKLDADGNCTSLRGNASHKGLIVAIYDDPDCTKLFDAKGFIQGQINTSQYEANATAEDYDEDGALVRRYKIYYRIENNAYKIFNLNSRGLAFSAFSAPGDQPITTTCNWWDYQVHFQGSDTPVTAINTSTNFKFVDYSERDGITAFWYTYDTAKRTTLSLVSEAENYYINGGVQGTLDNTFRVFGTYGADGGKVDHNHSTTSCPWITNDGDRKTGSTAADFYFYDYGLVYYQDSDYSRYNQNKTKGEFTYYEKYSKTAIYGLALNNDYVDNFKSESLDCTLDVELNLEAFGSNKSNIYVKGTITPKANTQFVDHYELCIKPGTEKSVKNFTTATDEPTTIAIDDDDYSTTDYRFAKFGFPGATSVADSRYDTESTNNGTAARVYRVKLTDDESEETQAETDASATFSFEKLISTSDLVEKANSFEDYSFYIMAVYQNQYYDESKGIGVGLSPTYSSIQSSPITTGIKSVSAEANDVKIYGTQGKIDVFGEVNNVAVYSISGAQIYNGSDKTIAVPTGIYIVKAGNTVAKVAVP